MSTLQAPPSGIAPPPRRWELRPSSAEAESVLAHEAKLSPLLAHLLTVRGIRTTGEAACFLHPSLDQLHDPYRMRGMAQAVARVEKAVALREPILIYGDYDVDGTLAVVLLKTAIERLGGQVSFHVPHRLREGYGMQSEVIEVAARENIRLVISVDTGIRDLSAAEAAESLGLDLIVTDHHLPSNAGNAASSALPKAVAILNPNQPGCEYPSKCLCGAGVAFKLAQALFESRDATVARTRLLPSFLKLLAIATVADSVPLVGENRVFVALGLEQLRHPVNPGLRALLEVAQLDPSRRPLTPIDVGFRLGPRINAAGRMDIASEVVELFMTPDPARVRAIARKLDHLNTERRNIEAEALNDILVRLDQPQYQSKCLVIDGEGWHRGVLGIVASRVVERTGKPTLVLTHEDGMAYGSGRSIPAFHLLNAIESCRDLFTRFGGHAHAAGFTLPSDKVPELRARLTEYASTHLSDSDLGSPLDYDAPLPVEAVNETLYAELRQLEPCGLGNEEPIFAATNLRITAPPRIMKEKHLRLRLESASGAAAISAVGWNWVEKFNTLGLQPGDRIDLAYKVRRNDHPSFGGIELEIAGLRPASHTGD